MDKRNVNPRILAYISLFRIILILNYRDRQSDIARCIESNADPEIATTKSKVRTWKGKKHYEELVANGREGIDMRDTNLDLEKRREESAMSDEYWVFSRMRA